MENSSTNKYLTLTTLLLFFCFFPTIPYLEYIRIDQILIYLLFIYFLAARLSNFALHLYFNNLIILYVTIFVIAITSGVINYNHPIYLSSSNLYSFISEAEDVTRIIAAIFVISCYLDEIEKKHLLKLIHNSINIYIILLIINCTVSIYIFYGGNTDFLYQFYWLADPDNPNDSVVGRSLSSGRISGIFSQPMEAGAAYGLGLILITYKILTKGLSISYLFVFLFILLGGFFSSSKIFYLGSFFCTLLLLLPYLKNIKLKSYIYLLFVVILFYYSLDYYKIHEFNFIKNILSKFTRILEDPSQTIFLISGGRFFAPDTESNAIQLMFLQVKEFAPIFGFGFGSFAASEFPIDSAYMHILYLTGTIGAILFVFVYITIIFDILTSLYKQRTLLNYTLFILLIFILGTNLGSPLFSLNRIGTIVILFFLMYYRYVLAESSKR